MLITRLKANKTYLVIVVAVVTIFGSILLVRSFAAIGDVVAFETEGGSLVGDAALVQDNDASSGQAVVLHATSPSPTPPPPTPTPPPGPVTCNGISISAGQSIQAAVDSHGENTTFCLQPGTYLNQSVNPKTGDIFIGTGDVKLFGGRTLTNFTQSGNAWSISGQTQQVQRNGECWEVPRCDYSEGLYINDKIMLHVGSRNDVGPGKWFFDYDADTIYIGDNPSGKRVETSVTEYAFTGGAANVTVKNMTIEKYSSQAQHGAIYPFNTSGWVIDGVTARWNHGGGIGFESSNHMTIRNSKSIENGQIGLNGNGDDNLIENNEIAGNNTADFNAGWEAGGTKFGESQRLIVRGNYSHDNIGPGLWTDYNNNDILYENNRVIHNRGAGIFHEISQKAVIRNNTIEDTYEPNDYWCYNAAIQISASHDVEVYGNTLKNNKRSIVGIAQDRGPGYEIYNLNVHDNTIENRTVSGSITGICRDENLPVFTAGANNRFTHNTYLGPGHEWDWNDQGMSFSQWQAAGQDTTGSYQP